MKKTRLITAILMALMVLLLVVPALANEGEGTMDVSPGGDEEQPPVVEPTDPPVVDPTEPPVVDPTEPPAPTDTPTDEPGPTDTPTDDPGPTEEPTDGPTEEPTSEPTEEPTPAPPIDNSGNTGGGDDSPGSATRPPVNLGGGIRQPNNSSRRPVSGSQGGSSGSVSGSSGSQEPIEDGPQYVTFARVTQKSNSMSRALFYGGAACIGAGVLGLGVLAVLIIRGRRADGREEIFAEIEQSAQAMRQPVRRPAPQQAAYEDDPYAQYDRGQDYEYEQEDYSQPGQGYARGYDAPAPSLHRPEPEDLAVPINGSMYTEEFELPPEEAGYQPGPAAPAEASVYTEEFEPIRQAPAPGGPVMPAAASMYTEEFTLPEEMSAPPRPQPRPAPQPQPKPRPVSRGPQPASKIPPSQMDTTELLREILHGDDKQ